MQHFSCTRQARRSMRTASRQYLTAAGVAADESRIKALIAALDGVNIEEAISKAAAAPVAVAAAAPAAGHAAAPAKEEHKEEDKKAEEESGMAGLGALFG